MYSIRLQCGCDRRCLQDVLKRFQNSETISGGSGGASGASRTACLIFNIERTLKKKHAEWG